MMQYDAVLKNWSINKDGVVGNIFNDITGMRSDGDLFAAGPVSYVRGGIVKAGTSRYKLDDE